MKKLFYFLSAFFMVVVLSGCLKDRITHLVEGHYTVSGIKVSSGINMDSLGHVTFYRDTTYHNNINVTINKVDTSTIEASIDLQEGGTGYCFYQPDMSSKSIFVFRGEIQGMRYGIAAFTFDAKELKKIEVALGYHIGNAHRISYNLSGTKN